MEQAIDREQHLSLEFTATFFGKKSSVNNADAGYIPQKLCPQENSEVYFQIED
ncbi:MULTISPECIES: hypothetical protein [unclassified Polynucleobacter]|uniref:hypothetical protein n=1 Tax=unclassified Polynucleobacter TaxID=2640945 RepID=UPI0025F2AD39|nr:MULTISPECIES: hypothetical protein [unclassified Polynucleobacter]